MRYSFLVLAFFACASLTSAAAPKNAAEAEIQELESRLYERVEFPARVRRMENSIKLAEARLKSLEKLLVEYQSFQKFSIGNPLTLTVEETKLQILDTKLQLKELRDERSLLYRYKDDQRRLDELRR